MVKITLSGTVPTGFEIVPTGTVAGANEVVYAHGVVPNDFGMNFHTYNVISGALVRNGGVAIDNRVIAAPVFLHQKAGIIASNTPAI